MRVSWEGGREKNQPSLWEPKQGRKKKYQLETCYAENRSYSGIDIKRVKNNDLKIERRKRESK